MNNLVLNRELDTYVDKSILESIDDNNFTEILKSLKSINLLPFAQGNIYFTNDVWDFSRYTNTNVNKNKRIFKFDTKRCPAAFEDIAKIYVLFKILEDNVKIQSVYDSAYKLMDFFRYIAKPE